MLPNDDHIYRCSRLRFRRSSRLFREKVAHFLHSGYVNLLQIPHTPRLACFFPLFLFFHALLFLRPVFRRFLVEVFRATLPGEVGEGARGEGGSAQGGEVEKVDVEDGEVDEGGEVGLESGREGWREVAGRYEVEGGPETEEVGDGF